MNSNEFTLKWNMTENEFLDLLMYVLDHAEEVSEISKELLIEYLRIQIQLRRIIVGGEKS